MPLSTGINVTDVGVRLEFDQAVYEAGDTIHFRVVVDGEPAAPHGELFTGTVTLPDYSTRQVSGMALVRSGPAYGPFSSPHYDVRSDPARAGWFIATPKEVPQ